VVRLGLEARGLPFGGFGGYWRLRDWSRYVLRGLNGWDGEMGRSGLGWEVGKAAGYGRPNLRSPILGVTETICLTNH
jgi:hypothetical protein